MNEIEGPTQNVRPQFGGQVHVGLPARITDTPWPVCRTGAATRNNTRYVPTTSAVTCEKCCGVLSRRKARALAA